MGGIRLHVINIFSKILYAYVHRLFLSAKKSRNIKKFAPKIKKKTFQPGGGRKFQKNVFFFIKKKTQKIS